MFLSRHHSTKYSEKATILSCSSTNTLNQQSLMTISHGLIELSSDFDHGRHSSTSTEALPVVAHLICIKYTFAHNSRESKKGK